MTQAYPLEWPQGWDRVGRFSRKEGGAFKVTFEQARKELYAELERLGAQSVVISSWLPLRLDGQPRGDASRMKLDDPGVAVYFELRGRRMVMARDAYTTVMANLRSVGLAVSYLRGLERHGGAAMMERAFTGFTALPSPDKTECFITLGINASASLADIDQAFRNKARKAHPDNGGSVEAMQQLSAARDMARQAVTARNG